MLNTQAKRMTAFGVARPWVRRVYPDGSQGALWRSSVGNGLNTAITVETNLIGQVLAQGLAGPRVSGDSLSGPRVTGETLSGAIATS